MDAGGGPTAPHRTAPPGRAWDPRVNRLRNRLILIFLAATLVPLAATVWITTSLLEYSVEYSSTTELDAIAKSVLLTGREYYQHMTDGLKKSAASGQRQPEKFVPSDRARWPEEVR